jgi:hypothetical protein
MALIAVHDATLMGTQNVMREYNGENYSSYTTMWQQRSNYLSIFFV